MTDAAIGVWGAGRVAVRISPLVPFNDMADSQPESLVTYVAQELSRRTIAFLEIRHENHVLPEEQAIWRFARRHFQGALMSNGSYTRESGESTGRAARPMRSSMDARTSPIRIWSSASRNRPL